tara:strand:+ start:35 stop:478 length:444 start_codon:yes stop_codon:yes gene_type:complete
MSTIKVDTIQKANGTSQIGIDKIGGVASAGTIAVIAEGGSTTTNLAQGLAKVFCTHNSSTAILNSHNISSLTDQATGITTHNYTNSFSAADNQSPLAMSVPGTDTLERPRGSTIASGSMLIVNEEVEGSTTDRDADRLFFTSHGDLA